MHAAVGGLKIWEIVAIPVRADVDLRFGKRLPPPRLLTFEQTQNSTLKKRLKGRVKIIFHCQECYNVGIDCLLKKGNA